MKKVIGYGFKLSGESIKHALSFYDNGGFHSSLKEVKDEIKESKAVGTIPKNCKLKIFKVVVEIEE